MNISQSDYKKASVPVFLCRPTIIKNNVEKPVIFSVSVIKIFFKCKFMELLMPAQVSIDTTKKVIPWLRKVSSIKKFNNLALWQERSYPSSIIEVHANKPPTKINKRASNPSLA